MRRTAEVLHVVQGQYRISADPRVELSTLLGSCVSICLHDPIAGIGGMNHFLLPGSDPESGGCVKYGLHAMEELINALLKAGAMRHRLQASLYGGANVVPGLTEVGAQNARFACQFVQDEGFALVARCVGGEKGRKVRFHPATGQGRSDTFEIDKRDPSLSRRTERPAQPSGTIELF